MSAKVIRKKKEKYITEKNFIYKNYKGKFDTIQNTVMTIGECLTR